MPTLFDLLDNENEPAVRAILGHWLFGYIHPFSDGNGRMARFIMNVQLATAGYPWTVIRNEDRKSYLAALEEASVGDNLSSFAVFVGHQMQWSESFTR
jgi:Fic family protein